MKSNELGPQNFWQCVRRAKLYLDLLQASNRKPPGLQQRRPFGIHRTVVKLGNCNIHSSQNVQQF